MVQSNLGPENRVQQSELLEMNNKIKSYNSKNSFESSSVARSGGQHQQKMEKFAARYHELNKKFAANIEIDHQNKAIENPLVNNKKPQTNKQKT